jgi:uncharacterized protein with von Willebrand factor type A (vWA) domain
MKSGSMRGSGENLAFSLLKTLTDIPLRNNQAIHELAT